MNIELFLKNYIDYVTVPSRGRNSFVGSSRAPSDVSASDGFIFDISKPNKNAAGAFAPSAAGDGIAEQPTSITDRIPHGESVNPLDLIDTRVSLSNNSDPQVPKGDFYPTLNLIARLQKKEVI